MPSLEEEVRRIFTQQQGTFDPVIDVTALIRAKLVELGENIKNETYKTSDVIDKNPSMFGYYRTPGMIIEICDAAVKRMCGKDVAVREG